MFELMNYPEIVSMFNEKNPDYEKLEF